MQEEPIDFRDIKLHLIEEADCKMPDMIVYADDCDFSTEIEEHKEKAYQPAENVLVDMNLIVDEDKTERTTVKRNKGRREQMEQRHQTRV